MSDCEACVANSIILCAVAVVLVAIVYSIVPVSGLEQTCRVYRHELRYGSGCYAVVAVQVGEKKGEAEYLLPGYGYFFHNRSECIAAHEAGGTGLEKEISCVRSALGYMYTSEYAYATNVIACVLYVFIVAVAAGLETMLIAITVQRSYTDDLFNKKFLRKTAKVGEAKTSSAHTERKATNSKLKSK